MDLYESVGGQAKLDFLDSIINENRDLQSSFVYFSNSVNHQVAGIFYRRFIEIISETSGHYKGRFEELDTENPDWESYQPSTLVSMKDWEQCQEASGQEVKNIFNEFKTKAVDTIILQNFDELTAMLVGLYKAALDADVDDPVETFEDVNEYLLAEHTWIMQEIVEKVKLSTISGSTITATCKLFFTYTEKEYRGNKHFAASFEDLLLVICGKTNYPGEILSLLDQSKVKRQFVPRLVLFLNQKAGNTKEWLQWARQFYKQNNDVAGQLLEYYFSKEKPEFRELANELFTKEPDYWALQLKQYVSSECDKALFVKVFYRLVVDDNAMEDFHKLRPHLTSEKLEKLLKEIRYDKSFKVQILAVEERYEEIKKIVQLHPYDWHYPELIGPILKVYPQFCFDQISEKIRRTIEAERGRIVYRHIVELLQLADTIPGFKAENRLLVRELYNHKPNLPALRDELRKEGLV